MLSYFHLFSALVWTGENDSGRTCYVWARIFLKTRGKNLSVLKNIRIRVHARPSKEIDNFARVVHFLVHFFAVTARLPCKLTRLRLSPPRRPLCVVGITLTQVSTSRSKEETISYNIESKKGQINP